VLLARHAVAEALAVYERELQERAVMLVSELVTNALIYADGLIHVTVSERREAIRIEVADSSPAPPVLRQPGPDDEHGRGLLLLSMLAHSWGTTPLPPGKVVWFELACGDIPGGGPY
jgi:anti-sigma regulatory factor (Ser/Thr protein kinase)